MVDRERGPTPLERILRTLRVTGLAVLASCAAPAGVREAGDPITLEDLGPLPAAVTPENARQVIRQCLQRHRRAATDAYRRVGYVFRPEGFVQLRFLPPAGGGEPARAARVEVDYTFVESVGRTIFTDLSTFRDVVRVTVRGRFRRWEGIVTPYRPSPAVGEEPFWREVGTLEVDFPASEAEAACLLVEALRVLKS